MPDLVTDGFIRVYWVLAIANINAPTVAELNAGTRLDTTMTADGLNISASTAAVDLSALSSTYGTEGVGRRSFSDPSLTIKRQTGTDSVFNALVYQTNGFVVVRRNVLASTAWASGDKAEVYPAQLGERSQAYGPNTVQRYSVPFKVTSDPNTNATVA